MRRNLYMRIDRLQTALRMNERNIREGTILAIDPSSGSRSCLPGYALFSAGKLTSAGTVPISEKYLGNSNYTSYRLREIAEYCRNILPKVDLLVIESLSPEINERTVIGNYLQNAHAIGAIVSNTSWDYIIEIYPWEWKEFIQGVYEKQDALDAINIGMAVIQYTNRR